MGLLWRHHRKLKAFPRLYPLSGRTALFLSSLLLFCSCILNQYGFGTTRSYPAFVSAFRPSQDQVIVEPIAKDHVDLTRSTITDEKQGRRQDALSGTGNAGASDSIRGSRRSIQVMPQEETSKLESPAIDVKHEKQASKTISAPNANKQTLAEYLHFTEKTALNYMHFHKTGGVSYKTTLFAFFDGKTKRNGEKVKVWESCYQGKLNGVYQWRCDWDNVWAMNETERNKLDVVFGHQYWKRGAGDFLNKRDMRTFSVIRHPFDRKVSFFFHFVVRSKKRDENKVTFEEIRDFVLYEKTRDMAFYWGQDRGPNYMAGRLLSDGFDGYVADKFHRYFEVKPDQEKQVLERSLRILRSYVFIGLQSEFAASKCMLTKTIKEFNAAHGIDSTGTDDIARTAPVVNTGSYKMSAAKIWNQLSVEERKHFNHRERIDLAIYNEGVRMFKQQVRRFECDHLVKKRHLLGS